MLQSIPKQEVVRLKRALRVLLLIAILAALVCSMTTVSYAADTYISNMDVVCTLDKYGNCDTVVTAKIFFGSPASSVSLPVGENAKDISVAGGTFSRKTVDGIHWLNLRNAAGTTGERTFVISFRQNHCVSVNNDKTQTMDIEVLCPYWNWRIDDFRFTVNMPYEYPESNVPTYISGYYGEGVAVSAERAGLTITGTILNPIMDQESLHVKLELPKGYCRVLHQKGTFSVVTSLVMWLLIGAAAVYWLLELANPITLSEDRRQPPEGMGAWEFPYVSACGEPELAYLIYEWANLGYVTVHVSAKNRIMIRRVMGMDTERRPYETQIFNALFQNGEVCQVDTAVFRRHAENAAAISSAYWSPRIFKEKSGNPRLLHLLVAALMGVSWFRCIDWILPTWTLRVLLIIPMLPIGFFAGLWLQNALQKLLRRQKKAWLPVLLISAVNVALITSSSLGGTLLPVLALVFQYLSAFGTYRGGKRTSAGLNAIAEIHGYRHELKTTGSYQLQLYLNQDPFYFYKILPYAEVMGIGRQFAESFENIRLEPCPWYFREDTHYRTAEEFYPYFMDTLQRMQRKAKGRFGRRLKRALVRNKRKINKRR